jgi:conjugal transfer pilus assembly protein TraF
MSLRLMLSAFLLVSSSSLSATWLERKAEGWSWHENMDEEEIQKEPEPEVVREPITSTEQMKKVREGLEEKLSKALLEPTPHNIQIYMREQKRWMDQSSYFASVWKKVVLDNPDLDATLDHPVSQYGIQLAKHIENDEKDKFIKELANEHGLFFYLKGGCKICLAFSKIVKMLEKRHSWSVIPISLDGLGTPEYPNARMDNGSGLDLGIDRAPSLFVVNPQTELIKPVSFGAISLEQVEQNIYLQFSEKGASNENI